MTYRTHSFHSFIYTHTHTHCVFNTTVDSLLAIKMMCEGVDLLRDLGRGIEARGQEQLYNVLEALLLCQLQRREPLLVA